LKSDIASEHDKKTLADALFHLREPSTGSLTGDVARLAALIMEYVHDVTFRESELTASIRLVINLGLQTSLAQYQVPMGDLGSIAIQALGREDDPQLGKVVELLEGLYSP
jgi:hypothetical protein